MARISSEVYVSSFTENADQLGQWRAYCPPTGGYAVGFRSKILAQFPTNEVQRFLTRCIYDGEGQYDLINSLVQVIANFAQDKIDIKLEHDNSALVNREILISVNRGIISTPLDPVDERSALGPPTPRDERGTLSGIIVNVHAIPGRRYSPITRNQGNCVRAGWRGLQ